MGGNLGAHHDERVARLSGQRGEHRNSRRKIGPRTIRERLQRHRPARALLLAENVARIQSSRLPFRGQLRELLKAPGPNISAEIEDLCNRFGREMPPEIQATYYRALRSIPRRMTTSRAANHFRVERKSSTPVL